MDDTPDIYVDAFHVTVAPFGVTLTLKRSIPNDDGVAEHHVVGRLRMTQELLLDLSRTINETVSRAATRKATKAIKH